MTDSLIPLPGQNSQQGTSSEAGSPRVIVEYPIYLFIGTGESMRRWIRENRKNPQDVIHYMSAERLRGRRNPVEIIYDGSHVDTRRAQAAAEEADWVNKTRKQFKQQAIEPVQLAIEPLEEGSAYVSVVIRDHPRSDPGVPQEGTVR